MRHILLLDDEEAVLHALQRNFRQIGNPDGLHVEAFTDPIVALERVAEQQFDLVISDYHMPVMNGVDFLNEVKRIQATSIRMMLSGALDPSTLLGAINTAEALRYIPKPWELEDLRDAYQVACQRYDALLEEHRLADERRVQKGVLSPHQEAMRRLQEEAPGIAKVNWGPDGAVLLEQG